MLFLVAMLVLVAIGVLLWKAVSAQALATGAAGEDDPPTGPTRPPGSGRSPRTRPVAPDDDPEFLRGLDEQLRRPKPEDPPAVS